MCSLRSAVEAANNLKKPVKIVLGATTYELTLISALEVTNPAGTSIVGKGSSVSIIEGDGAGDLEVSAAPAAASGLLFLSGSKVEDGAATDGGGIYLDDTNSGATAVLTSDVITENLASTDGGGIYAADYATLYMTNTKLSGNVATEGAGVYANTTDGYFANSTITGNTTSSGSTDYGAGVFWYEGALSVKGGSINGNTAGTSTDSGYGGAIYSEYGDIELSGVTVDNNTVKDGGAGGALYLYFALTDMTKGSISHNTAATGGAGGGVYNYDAQLGLHGATMTGDTVAGTATSGNGGGAIYSSADEYADQLTVDSGTRITGANNSAIYLYAYQGGLDANIANSTLSNNHDASLNGYSVYGCGGAICSFEYDDAQINLSMTGDTLSQNTSAGTVGSGAVSVYSFSYGGTSLALTGNSFSHNSTGADGYGGALGLISEDSYATVSARLASNSFTGNRAGTTATAGYGGAIALFYYAALTDVGSVFSGNKAIGDGAYGGAIYNDGEQSERYSRTKLLGNSAGGSTGDGYGGGMYTDAYAGTLLSQVTISGNTAAAEGGGIYSSSYGVLIDQSTISRNTAGTTAVAGEGGGIYDDSSMAVQNSTITGNKAASITSAAGEGGGIYIDTSHAGLRYSTVSSNVAKQGGGIYTNGDGGTLLGSIVSANHAASGGGEQDCTNNSATTTLNSLGGNVLGSAHCVAGIGTGDRVTSSPGLRSLGNYGGPTKTEALKAGSPAIARSSLLCPSTDQRGQSRLSSRCDAGAYQRAPGSVTKVHPGTSKGAKLVTISGSGFSFAKSVHFGAHKAKFQIVSDHKIIARVPTGHGTVKVSVTTSDGSGKKGHFTYKQHKHHKH